MISVTHQMSVAEGEGVHPCFKRHRMFTFFFFFKWKQHVLLSNCYPQKSRLTQYSFFKHDPRFSTQHIII